MEVQCYSVLDQSLLYHKPTDILVNDLTVPVHGTDWSEITPVL